jgi:hypothetical protein
MTCQRHRQLRVVLATTGLWSCQSISGVGDLFIEPGTDGGEPDARVEASLPDRGVINERFDASDAGDASDSGDAGDRMDLPIAPEADVVEPPEDPKPPPYRSFFLPLSRDGVRTDVFAVLGDGQLYVTSRPTVPLGFTGFKRIVGAAEAPPFASLAGVARDAADLQVLYVDKAGQVQEVSWNDNEQAYQSAPIRPNDAAFGGPGTAPPGAPLSVIAMSSRRVDALLADNSGTPMLFEWTAEAGWKRGLTLPITTFPPGAPLTLISHQPGVTMEVTGVGNDGYVWGTWCADGCDGTWHPGKFTEQVQFLPGTVLSVMSKGVSYEEIVGVDGSGQVWRAWWTPFTWVHEPEGYLPFGVFSSPGMLPPGATIAVNARSPAWANIQSVDENGAIQSQWLQDGLWHPAEVPWESRTDREWLAWFNDSASPKSVTAMLGNVGGDGDLDNFWIKIHRKVEFYTAHATHSAPEVWDWNFPSRIDGQL